MPSRNHDTVFLCATLCSLEAKLYLRIKLMKFLLALTILCLSVVFASAQKSPGLPSGQAEILDLLQTWNQAELKGDEAGVAKLLAPEFSFLGGSNRKEYLALIKPDTSLVIESVTIDEADIQIYDNTAVATSLNSFKVKKDGKPLEAKFIVLTIWIKRNGNWQCVKASQQEAKA